MYIKFYVLSGSTSVCVVRVWPANTHHAIITYCLESESVGEKQAACTWLDCSLRRRKLMPLTLSVTSVPRQWKDFAAIIFVGLFSRQVIAVAIMDSD